MTRVTARTAGRLGISFVLLLFISAGMVTLPSSAQTPQIIADFYAANRSIVLIAQAVGLLAAPLFIAFALGFEKTVTSSPASRRVGPIGLAGIIVGVVSVGTSVPVIVLALTTVELLLWVRMTDLSDAVLFLVIGVFCVLITVCASRTPAWLRTTAGFAGFFALARSGAGFLEITPVLDLIAPFAFLVFMLAASIHLLLVGRGAAA